MTDSLHHIPQDIPLSEIDATALPRDRGAPDPEADAELRDSITLSGLRQPIEVFPVEPAGYALISGFRRLKALRALGHDTAPAFIRQPASIADALAAMVTENEIRAPVSPWDKGALVLRCLQLGLHDTPDAAIDALFPALSRQKRSRLRGFVSVVEAFEGRFATPDRLTTARLDRLAAALRSGWEDLIRNALPPSRTHSLDSQWSEIEPLLAEALSPEGAATAPGTKGAPRRSLTLRQGLTIRRELTRNGWVLRFSGPQAKTPGLMEDVMEYVERMFQKG
ncbi:ParB/RepB/Spo0J family partition protein [Citreimonas salinaria]|uniref:Chromosome partitioning protein, ParB family n=1 Tax=Citreimonas salinaria TaxID=321339 RepID=A0A1H3L5U7_9RHOB|nr:ParB N-terminal domain-containing protein [Citreimonas salinaria]SDY59710.1 chromosome partitioning protein, ParB family [Citreimonas salinaria]